MGGACVERGILGREGVWREGCREGGCVEGGRLYTCMRVHG